VADQHLYKYTAPHFTYRGQYVQAIMDAPAEVCFCDFNQPIFFIKKIHPEGRETDINDPT
jgi:hypothetical protein